MRKVLCSIAFALLAVAAGAAGLSSSELTRVEPIGYRIGSSDEILPFDASVVTVTPGGVSIAASNAVPLKLAASVSGDYKIVRWQKFAEDPRARAGVLPAEAAASDTLTVAYEAGVPWMYVVVVVDYDLKVKAGLSSFGRGTVTVEPEKAAYVKGESVRLTVQPDGGHSFVRWSDGNADHVRNLVLDTSVDLRAYIEPNSCRVVFSVDEGAVLDMTEKAVRFGCAYGELPVPVHKGLVFVGWKDEFGQMITSESTSGRAGDHVLTAVWEIPPESYTVVFDANGGTGTQTRVNQVFEVGAAQKLRINTFYKPGSVFVGWNQNAGAEERQYSDEQIVQNLAPAGTELTLFAVWRAEKVAYTVHFNKNADDATGTMIDQQFAGGEEKPLAGCNFRRAGWTFLGWSTDGGAIEATYQDRERVQDLTTQKELTLYAVWTKNPVYYVHYMKTGRDTEDWKSETVEQGKEYALSATNGLERTGYAFIGWMNGTASATYPAGKKCTKQELEKMVGGGDAITFVADWKPITYTLRFDGNGGTCKLGPRALTYDTPYTVEYDNSAVSRDHHVFLFWSTDPKETNVVYRWKYGDVPTVTNLTTVAGDTVTWHAIWKGANVTVKINGKDVPLEYGSQLEQPADPVRTGYAFIGGWTTNGVSVTFPITVTDYFDLEPENKWAPVRYAVSFHGTDGTYETGGTMADQEFAYDVAQALTSNAFLRAGYTFASWTNAVGKAFADGEQVENLATNDGAVVDLYATWTMNSRYYAVRFNPNGGAGDAYSQNVECGVATALTPNRFARTGYGFAGWTAAESGGSAVAYTNGQMVTDLAVEGATNDLYALWTPNTFRVKFDGNGADGGEMTPQEFTYDVAQALTSNAFARTGHVFAGWTNATATGMSPPLLGDGAVVSNLTAEADAANTLRAVWTANAYTVKFHPNGGSGEAMAPQAFTYDKAQQLTENTFKPPETWMVFVGWSNATGKVIYNAGAVVSNLTAEANGTVDLHAVWGDDSYTVTFDGNGATGGSMGLQIFKHGGSGPLALNAYTRIGHTFENWTNDDGDVYSDGANFTARPEGIGETLHAAWTVNEYNCEFDTDSRKKKYGEAISPPQDPTKTGYVFKGWTTNGTDIVDFTGFTMPAHDVVFTSVWEPIEYTIAFDGNGADGGAAMASTNVKYDVEIALPSNTYERAGYAFEHWTNSVGKVFKDGATVAVKDLATTDGATVTLYAVWQETGNPLSIALGAVPIDWNTISSPDNCWTPIGKAGEGVRQNQLSPEGYLEIPFSEAGNLTFTFMKSGGAEREPALTFNGNDVEFERSLVEEHDLTIPKPGNLKLKGTPDKGAWTLQFTSWTPSSAK